MIKLGAALVLVSCALAQQPGGFVRFDWDKLASKAVEKVDLNLEGPMLEMASKFLSDKPDEASVKKLIQGLKGVYVKTFEFDKEGQYTEADLGDIRRQLRGPDWSTMMEMKDRGESVAIYVRSNSSKQTTGLVVLATEPKELTFVQIDGPIDPSMLGSLGGNFGIPKMNLGPLVNPKSNPGAPRKKND